MFAVVYATTLCDAKIACRDEVHPDFNAWFRFTDLACVLESLVISVDIDEEYAEEVSS